MDTSKAATESENRLPRLIWTPTCHQPSLAVWASLAKALPSYYSISPIRLALSADRSHREAGAHQNTGVCTRRLTRQSCRLPPRSGRGPSMQRSVAVVAAAAPDPVGPEVPLEVLG